MENFTKQWKDRELKNLAWECARSTTINQLNANIERLKRLNEKAWTYLDKWPKDAWTKAYFNKEPKVDNICNNACAVLNAKIAKYRTKSILIMAKEVRRCIS